MRNNWRQILSWKPIVEDGMPHVGETLTDGLSKDLIKYVGPFDGFSYDHIGQADLYAVEGGPFTTPNPKAIVVVYYSQYQHSNSLYYCEYLDEDFLKHNQKVKPNE
jgi:hypothetical protein